LDLAPLRWASQWGRRKGLPVLTLSVVLQVTLNEVHVDAMIPSVGPMERCPGKAA
jgi:hypothetical protein